MNNSVRRILWRGKQTLSAATEMTRKLTDVDLAPEYIYWPNEIEYVVSAGK